MESNALIRETSPYLLQHAHNPVQWYPWGPGALERARREDKPILLSIGYSACHWCHVMAHESFEDEATARVMNEHFINIKVDREERPDIDKIYQTAQQLLTRRTGGWPLTMFLTPDDHVPFFGGTYFPPEPRYGLPGFRDLLLQVSRFYRSERDAIAQQNRSMVEALRQLERPARGRAEPDAAALQEAVEELAAMFDSRHGGFGGAPKFPHPSNLEFLLHYLSSPRLARPDDERPRQMLLTTLRHMAEGGIYDHVGGGFCRYSVDQRWMIPHFEKMLYDNGPLLGLYADAFALTDDAFFRRVADGIADWVQREMQSPEGGYYSSLDADSEGEEGKFYLWTPDAVREVLTPEEYRAASLRFGLDGPANFEGHWHLQGVRPLEEVARELSLDAAAAQQLLESACARLLEARAARVRPGRDDKVLTSWNALMIRGMARAAFRLGREDCYASASRAMAFLQREMWHDGRLLATWKDGRAHLRAYLDDHALLLDAILALLQCRWSTDLLHFALEIAEALLRDFTDDEGGFCFTAHDHEQLLQRRKDFMDDAVPSGNGIAAAALARLGHLTGDERLLAAAHDTLRAGMNPVAAMPHACGTMLIALGEHADPPPLVILRGDVGNISPWRSACVPQLNLRAAWYEIPGDATALPRLLEERRPRDGAAVTAYLCEGFNCRAPVTEPGALAASLNVGKSE